MFAHVKIVLVHAHALTHISIPDWKYSTKFVCPMVGYVQCALMKNVTCIGYICSRMHLIVQVVLLCALMKNDPVQNFSVQWSDMFYVLECN